MMVKYLSTLLCALCFMCGETQAKASLHRETATEEISNRWLLEAELLQELHAIVDRNTPERPNK